MSPMLPSFGPRAARVAALALLALLYLAPSASADDTGLTEARLIERADGGVAIEAEVPPALLAALRAPLFPERFGAPSRPEYGQLGFGITVRWEVEAAEDPLGPGDVIVLPWARSAVIIDARWADGTRGRALFPGSFGVIRVRVDQLRAGAAEPRALALAHVRDGAGPEVAMALRLLLVLAIVAAAGRRADRLALAASLGYLLAPVALDVGVPALDPALGRAGLGVGAALLARAALRGTDAGRLAGLVLVVGVVDGLGLAGGAVSDAHLASTFGAAAPVGLAVALGAALLSSAAALRAVARRVAPALGVLGVALGAAAFDLGVRSSAVGEGSTVQLEASAASGAGGVGARAAPAPRALENTALVFLSMEPREVRVEALLKLADFTGPLGIDATSGDVVGLEAQAQIVERTRDVISSLTRVRIDGRDGVALLERADFVTLAATGVSVVTGDAPIALTDAIVGVTLVYGADRPPTSVSLSWGGFPTSDAAVPAIWSAPTGSGDSVLTIESPVLEWTGDFTSLAGSDVTAVTVEPPRWPLVSLALLALAGLIARTLGRRSEVALSAARGGAIGALCLWPFLRAPVQLPFGLGERPSTEGAAAVVDDVLTNVYRSFDLRDEGAIYDRLAVSVTGDALSDVYLENRRALELENRGGARARVDDVEVFEVESIEPDDGGYLVRAAWTVAGSVNHFGHVHYRRNRYDARLSLVVEEGAWKLRGIDVLDEQREL
ncbi:MAG: hypothetical protein AAGI22_02215 [Planctomycetota bacterium]